MRGTSSCAKRITPDFSGVRDREALLSFQAVANYCLSCSDDSSEGDYDLTWEFFMVDLAGPGEDATNDAADPPTNLPAEPPANSAMPRAVIPTSHT